MQVEIATIVRNVRDAVENAGIAVALGHAYQIVAAAFGYSSLAALQASDEESSTLADASHVALDARGMADRAKALNYNSDAIAILGKAITNAVSSIKSPPKVCWELEELLEDLYEEIQEVVYQDETIAGEAATTNADWGDVEVYASDPRVPLTLPASQWVLPVTGTLSMDQHEDRMFFGDEIAFSAELRFDKVGRVCLSNWRFEIVGAEVVDSSAAD